MFSTRAVRIWLKDEAFVRTGEAPRSSAASRAEAAFNWSASRRVSVSPRPNTGFAQSSTKTWARLASSSMTGEVVSHGTDG